jgi:hypothetical protein
MNKRIEIFRNYLFEFLKELSDRQYQEHIWANTYNPDSLIASYTEAFIGLFDDANVGYALEEGAVIYDKKVTQALSELSACVDLVDDNRSPEEIINDPHMQRVRDKASEILALIEVSDKSENTVTFIEEGTLKILEP